MTQAIRLAFVTDIHHGRQCLTKAGPAALDLLEEFRRFVAEARPDYVLDLGDRISDVSREADLALERDVAESFRRFSAPRIHVDGNHDVDYLSVADNDLIFGRNAGSETIDIGDWRLAVWRADTRIHWPGTFSLPERDLQWLAETVAGSDRPLAIVSHVPVSGQSLAGNYWFENNAVHASYPTAGEVRAVLRGARVPVLWISGHVHWNSITMVDGIAHLSLQSLTETFATAGEPAAAFALLELSDRVLWRVHGRDPFEWSADRASLARRWKAPLPNFAELRRRRPPSSQV